MTYLVAIVLSLLVCAQGAATEIVDRNIAHLKNGREPNASAALFPNIPLLQLVALGVAWVLERLAPNAGLWILVGLFLLFSAPWLAYFVKARDELSRMHSTAEEAKGA